MTRKTFEEIGRDADRALRSHTAAAVWAEAATLAGTLSTSIQITIKGANWSDGTLPLQDKMNSLLAPGLEQLIEHALAAIRDDADETLAEARAALDNPTAPPPTRGVPRSVPIEEGRQDQAGGASGLAPTGDALAAVRAQFDALSQPAREMLAWVRDNPGKVLAGGMPRDLLRQMSLIEAVGRGASQTWTLTERGVAVLEPAAPKLP